jgi:perosamine synthetase
MIPHNRIAPPEKVVDQMVWALESGHLTDGFHTRQLADKLARLSGKTVVTLTKSGTRAWEKILNGFRIDPGDEVVIPAYVCASLRWALIARHTTPVYADLDPETLNVTVETVKACLTARTRLILVVHLFGLPAPIREIRELGLHVIEDCSHGFGHHGMGLDPGTSFLSFYATKLLGGERGGAILSDHQSRENRHSVQSELSCALALANLNALDAAVAWRTVIAGAYRKHFEGLAKEGLVTIPGNTTNRVWYRFCLTFARLGALEAVRRLQAEGVEARTPVDAWPPVMAAMPPNAVAAWDRVVSIPCYPSLTEDEQMKVIRAVHRVVQS